ncbi:MAG: hypothetical protein JHC33_13625 [Ignisphaera sp.]|nr:hypothetical protein [Ignisphaera sp.]
MATFIKHDGEKNRLELIDPAFILGIGEVLTFGAKKYEANNWKDGSSAENQERIQGAMLRHFMAYLQGEELDPESNLPHLHHMAVGAMFLGYFDDRA